MKRIVCSCLAAAIVCVFSLRAVHAADGAASPEASFEAFKGAMKTKDYKGAFAQTTPESQELTLGGIAIFLTSMPGADPAKADEANKILEKHGVKKPDLSNPAAMQDPAALMKQMVVDVKDKPAAIADIMTYMEKSQPDQQKDAQAKSDAMANAKLDDLKVEGDAATGTVKVNAGGQEQAQPMMFKKVGNTWYLDLAGLQKRAMQGAAPGAN